jgi:hypothetical protein
VQKFQNLKGSEKDIAAWRLKDAQISDKEEKKEYKELKELH